MAKKIEFPENHEVCEKMSCIDKENEGKIILSCEKCQDREICMMTD